MTKEEDFDFAEACLSKLNVPSMSTRPSGCGWKPMVSTRALTFAIFQAQCHRPVPTLNVSKSVRNVFST